MPEIPKEIIVAIIGVGGGIIVAIINGIASKRKRNDSSNSSNKIETVIYYPNPETVMPTQPVSESENGSTYHLPDRNIYFSGRNDDLSDIYDYLHSRNKVIVTGNGGFGKTQTAVEYAYRHMLESDKSDGDSSSDTKYKHLCYFNATSENQLKDDYREFAMRKIGLQNAKEEDFNQIRIAIEDWLMKNTPYLLIYDNAEGCPNLNIYLPAQQDQGHIIINSRQHIDGIVAEKLTSDKFSEEDAFNFLNADIPILVKDKDGETTKRIRYENENTLRELAEELECIPLALECAAAYIEEVDDCTAERYLNMWKQQKYDLLDTRTTATDYKHTILTTWTVTFDDMKKKAESDELIKAALQLFNLCIYCESENIPLQMFIEGRNYLGKPIPEPLIDYLLPDNTARHIKLVRKLKRFSLVSMKQSDSDGILITVHRLIQEVAVYNFKKRKKWVRYCLNIAENVLHYKYGTKEDFDKFTLNLPHVLKIADKSERLLTDDESKAKTASLYHEVGFGFNKQGNYAQSLEYYHKALEIRKKVLGNEHIDTATTYNNIALVYNNQGNYDKSLMWYYKDLEISEKVLGKENTSTAVTYNNIASVYDHQGDYETALTWYYKSLEIREKVLGKEHPSTAITYNNIAAVYDNQCDYGKALTWYNKALEIKEKVLGKEHPSTATTYNNIAFVYNNQGEYGKARDLLCRAVIIWINCGLENHTNTKSAIESMCACYEKAGGTEEDFDAWFEERMETYPAWCEEIVNGS